MSVAEDGLGHDKRPSPECTGGAYCCGFIFILIFIFSFVIAYMHGACEPEPYFAVNDVKFYTFNLSSTLTSNLQITITSRNYYSGFQFDQLDTYVSYRNLQITMPTTIPPTYIDTSGVVVWSPYLNGNEVPLTPSLAELLTEDKTGTMLINVILTGQMRSKYGFVSGRYGLRVNCREYIMFENNNGSNVIGSDVKNPFDNDRCDIHVKKLG